MVLHLALGTWFISQPLAMCKIFITPGRFVRSYPLLLRLVQFQNQLLHEYFQTPCLKLVLRCMFCAHFCVFVLVFVHHQYMCLFDGYKSIQFFVSNMWRQHQVGAGPHSSSLTLHNPPNNNHHPIRLTLNSPLNQHKKNLIEVKVPNHHPSIHNPLLQEGPPRDMQEVDMGLGFVLTGPLGVVFIM